MTEIELLKHENNELKKAISIEYDFRQKSLALIYFAFEKCVWGGDDLINREQKIMALYTDYLEFGTKHGLIIK